MSESNAMSTETDAINSKLDAMMLAKDASDAPQFDAVEVAALKQAIKFVTAFHGDPAELLEMAKMLRDVRGFIKVGRNIGLVLAFLVVLVTNWDRIIEFAGRLIRASIRAPTP